MARIDGNLSRRSFLVRCLAGGAGLFASQRLNLGGLPIVGPNDRVRVGIVGLGNTGLDHLRQFLRLANVEIAALCDIDESRFTEAQGLIGGNRQKPPIYVTDYRQLADMKEVDAVSIATPTNRRVEMALDYCSAHKELLIERPFSTTAAEGEGLVKAAIVAKRIIQQRDDTFLFSTDGVSPVAMSQIGRINCVSGWKSLPVSGNRAGLDGVTAMVERAWTDLDLSRCIIRGHTPHRITARSTGDPTRGFGRVGFEIDYRVADQNVSISFEVRAGFPAVESVARFAGEKGNLTIYTDSTYDDTVKLASYANFVECIIRGNPRELINPIDEARKSNLVVELAKKSLISGEPLFVDPVTEVTSSATAK